MGCQYQHQRHHHYLYPGQQLVNIRSYIMKKLTSMSDLCIEIEDLYNKGFGISEIAKMLGIDTEMVEGGLDTMGVTQWH